MKTQIFIKNNICRIKVFSHIKKFVLSKLVLKNWKENYCYFKTIYSLTKQISSISMCNEGYVDLYIYIINYLGII